MKRAAGCLVGAFLFGLGILGCADEDDAPSADTGGRGSGGNGGGAATGGSGDGGATSGGSGDGGEPGTSPGFYEQRDLVADRPGFAEHVDEELVNPWGIASGPDTFLWVA